MTAQNLIASALRLIGALASGEAATGAEANDGLAILNDMLDEWNSERLSVFTVERNGGSTDALRPGGKLFPLVPSQQTYTIGEDGTPDFDVVRPAKIVKVSLEYLGNPNTPIELPMKYVDETVWRQIPVKSTQANIPHVMWDDHGFPNRTLSVYTVPSEVHNLILYMWVPLTSFAALANDNSYPPGYIKALRYNLAVDLAPEWQLNVPRDVMRQAISSKAKIRAMNTPTPILRTDPAIPRRSGHYNYYTDEVQ